MNFKNRFMTCDCEFADCSSKKSSQRINSGNKREKKSNIKF